MMLIMGPLLCVLVGACVVVVWVAVGVAEVVAVADGDVVSGGSLGWEVDDGGEGVVKAKDGGAAVVLLGSAGAGGGRLRGQSEAFD